MTHRNTLQRTKNYFVLLTLCLTLSAFGQLKEITHFLGTGESVVNYTVKGANQLLFGIGKGHHPYQKFNLYAAKYDGSDRKILLDKCAYGVETSPNGEWAACTDHKGTFYLTKTDGSQNFSVPLEIAPSHLFTGFFFTPHSDALLYVTEWQTYEQQTLYSISLTEKKVKRIFGPALGTVQLPAFLSANQAIVLNNQITELPGSGQKAVLKNFGTLSLKGEYKKFPHFENFSYVANVWLDSSKNQLIFIGQEEGKNFGLYAYALAGASPPSLLSDPPLTVTGGYSHFDPKGRRVFVGTWSPKMTEGPDYKVFFLDTKETKVLIPLFPDGRWLLMANDFSSLAYYKKGNFYGINLKTYQTVVINNNPGQEEITGRPYYLPNNKVLFGLKNSSNPQLRSTMIGDPTVANSAKVLRKDVEKLRHYKSFGEWLLYVKNNKLEILNIHTPKTIHDLGPFNYVTESAISREGSHLVVMGDQKPMQRGVYTFRLPK